MKTNTYISKLLASTALLLSAFCINETKAQNVGIGEASPTARLHVKSAGNTNATSALKLYNSSNTLLFHVKDDGTFVLPTITSALLKTDNTGTVKPAVAGVDYQIPVIAGKGILVMSNDTIKLSNTGVTAGTYGDATHTTQVTVDAQGRVTAVNTVAVNNPFTGATAGGDLTGTYPNPTVSKINGQTPATVATSGSYADLTNKPTSMAPSGTAGGDLSGTYPNPTVANIQGKAVSSTAPTDAQFFSYNNILSKWTAVSMSGDATLNNAGAISVTKINGTTAATVATSGSYTDLTNKPTSMAPSGNAGGDLSGTYPNPTVANIQGKAVSSTAPTDAQLFTYNNTSSKWTPVSVSGDATITNAGVITLGQSSNQYIKNQTGSAQTAGFNINGSGTLGGSFTVSGSSTFSGNITASGNITSSGNYTSTGTISTSGGLTSTAGLTASAAAVNLNANSNNATNINTGTSTGTVTIGGSANSINLPGLSASAMLMTDASHNIKTLATPTTAGYVFFSNASGNAEWKAASYDTTTTQSATFTAGTTVATITLPAGTFMLQYYSELYFDNGKSGEGNNVNNPIKLTVTTGSTTLVNVIPAASASQSAYGASGFVKVSPTTSTTYKLIVTPVGTTTGNTYQYNVGRLYATRLQ